MGAAVYCPQCGRALGAPLPDICPYCRATIPGAPVAGGAPLPNSGSGVSDRPTGRGSGDPHSCPSCQVPMTNLGELQFRVGGAAGGTGWFLGNWNQLSERLQPFAVYHCATCGRIQFFEPGR
jgi:hypothetical protein